MFSFSVRAACAENAPGRGREAEQPKAGRLAVKPTGQSGAGRTIGSSGSRAAQAPAKKAKGEGLKGFSGNPFLLERRNGPARRAPARTAKADPPAGDSRVVFSGGTREKPDDRLVPRRSAFSGGPDTLPRMDEKDPPEMSMTYKLNNRATTRVSLNQRDEASPLYLPREGANGVNGAGVYMHMDVEKDLQLRLGGEYQELDSDRHADERAKGASVGLRWSF